MPTCQCKPYPKETEEGVRGVVVLLSAAYLRRAQLQSCSKFLQSVAASHADSVPLSRRRHSNVFSALSPSVALAAALSAQKPELLRNKFADQRTAKVTVRESGRNLAPFHFLMSVRPSVRQLETLSFFLVSAPPREVNENADQLKGRGGKR